MSTTVADALAARLEQGGIERVYTRETQVFTPVVEALSRRKFRLIGLQSDAAAAFAAAGEALLTENLTLCCGSGSCGSVQLLGGLSEAYLSSASVLTLAPHVATSVIGSRYFQESRPEWVLRACSGYCETVWRPSQTQRVLDEAVRCARGERTVGVAVLPEDVTGVSSVASGLASRHLNAICPAVAEPAQSEVTRLAELINKSRRVVFLCGCGCAASRDIIVELAQRLHAPIAYTLKGKDIMEKDNPCAVGMIGLLGWGDAPAVVQVADLLVMWGTDFPYGCFLPSHGQVVQVDSNGTALGRRTRLCHAVHGDVGRTAAMLLPLLHGTRSDDFLARSLMRHGREVSGMEYHLRVLDEQAPPRPEYITRLISSHAEPDAVFCIDIGPPVIWAARYLQAFGKRRLIGSFKYGATGCALAMAIGAKAAFPSRQVIALCAAEELNQQMAELLTLVRQQLNVKVFVYNASAPHSENWGGNSAMSCPTGNLSLLARSMGMQAHELTEVAGAAGVVRRWLAERGPALLDGYLDVHALAEPPGSDLLRAINHLDLTPGYNTGCELEAVKRLLFGNGRFYS